jgi:hypothetical protein
MGGNVAEQVMDERFYNAEVTSHHWFTVHAFGARPVDQCQQLVGVDGGIWSRVTNRGFIYDGVGSSSDKLIIRASCVRREH